MSGSGFTLAAAPLLPWLLLVLFAAAGALCLGFGILRRAPGLGWRAIAIVMLLAALVNPSLIEEQRAPRIFGFFPIMLLGAQFLLLFVLHGGRTTSVEWLGLGCALVALPVLLTADAVARVFQQRTGDLVRPLPWSIRSAAWES